MGFKHAITRHLMINNNVHAQPVLHSLYSHRAHHVYLAQICGTHHRNRRIMFTIRHLLTISVRTSIPPHCQITMMSLMEVMAIIMVVKMVITTEAITIMVVTIIIIMVVV